MIGKRNLSRRRRGPRLLVAAALAFALCGAADRAARAGYAAFVIDARTGSVLHRENADTLNYPASLTKLMTLYLVFESLDHGVIALDTRLPVSARAASRPPSRIGLRAGQTIALRDAIRTLAVKSANDVATVIAEYFSGSEQRFARLMTARARALGMTRTTFRNASGLPDRRQRTTARDVATLSLALYKRFPHHVHYFASRSVTFRGQRYRNTNRLLAFYPGMNGIKTGYIHASGYNLAASVERDGMHVIAVVMGGKTARRRNDRVRVLLDRTLVQAAETRDFLASVRRPRPRPVRGAARAADGPAAWRGGWSIQLGAYAGRDAAEEALDVAQFVEPRLYTDGERRIERIARRGTTLYRALHVGLTEGGARRACGEMERHALPCAVVAAPTS